MTLADQQAAFWHDLWHGPHRSDPPGFAVYRNTVLKGCADALLSLHPAVRCLGGDEWMQAVALDFAKAHPPSGGDLQHYGAGFAGFLDAALAGSELPWLADVARLDRLWNESHVAADGPVLSIQGVARFDPERLGRSRLVPHPAARWRWNGTWPTFSLWQAARAAADDPNPPHWQGQGALFTRPQGAVQAVELDPAACSLLDLCAASRPLGAALDEIAARHPGSAPADALGLLLNQGAFTAIEDTSP